ncbi:MAG: hypothetical protein AAGA11_17085, partial [Pseudomonadota bacterium]
GQGSISADGRRVAVVMHGGGDGALVALDLETQTVVGGLRFAGKDGPGENEIASISPNGRYLLTSGQYDDLYGTSFGSSKLQLYAYDLLDLRHSNRQLAYVHGGHFDVGENDAGQQVIVAIGYNPLAGWAGRTTTGGETAGIFAYNLDTQQMTHITGTALWDNRGMPAGHMSMPLDGRGVAVLSSYQGGHPDSNPIAQNNAIIAIDVDTNEVAWLGWDEGDNTGLEPAGGTSGYYAQPHVSLVQSAQYADGSTGWKWAWGSDNRSTGSAADFYVGELICN